MLYTDAANATSNALYQRLGFRHDHDAIQIGFVSRETALLAPS